MVLGLDQPKPKLRVVPALVGIVAEGVCAITLHNLRKHFGLYSAVLESGWQE
jgi:hypothetical protein